MMLLLLAALAAPGTAAFEANVGQAPVAVSHLVRGDHEIAYVTDEGFVLSVPTADTVVSLRARWRGADRYVTEGKNELQGKFHYFIDGPEARTSRRYRGLVARSVYRGIDLHYDLRETLRFGFVAAAGADITEIRLGFDDDVELRVEAKDAEIDIKRSSGPPAMTVRLSKLRAWQVGNKGREPVDVQFVLRDDSIGFALGPHDPRRAVHIDPDITYASYIGSTGTEEGRDVAVDAAGMVYVTGYIINPGTMFPTTQGAFQTLPQGGLDAYVVKVDPSQTGAASLVYGSFLGGNLDDRAESIAVDVMGRAVIGGATSFLGSNTFVTTANAYSQTPQSSFVAVLTAAGSQLVYSTFFGGTSTGVTAVAVDPSGGIIAVGASGGGVPEVNNIPPPHAAAFAVKFDITASQAASVVYGTRLNAGPVRAVDVDATGIYLFGRDGPTLATTPGAAQTMSGGGNDYYVTKLDPNQVGAAAIRYTTFVGGADDEGNAVLYDGIAVDTTGAVYATGVTFNNFVTTPGAYATAPPGGGEGFLVKISPAGDQFVFSTYLGATGNDGGYDVAVDAAGQAYVVGYGGGVPVGSCGGPATGGGFVAQYDAQGQNLIQASYLSAGANLRPYAIAVGPGATAYVTGSVAPPTQIVTPGAFQTVQRGPDAFVAEMSPSAPCADLDVSLAATPNPVSGAATVQLQATLQNLGPDDVPGAQLSVFVPPEFTVQSVLPAGCTGGPNYDCPTAALTAGAATTVTFELQALAAGTFTATAAVTSMVNDPDIVNDAAQVAIVVTAPNTACGFETLFGSCDGATLRFCEDQGRPAERLVQVDCATDAFPAGVLGECTLINDSYGFDCAVSTGGVCAFIDAQDEPVFALCAGQDAGCRIDPTAGVALCEEGLPACMADGFDPLCTADLLLQECQVDQPVLLDCAAIGGVCANTRCEELPAGSPCEDERLVCAAGLICDDVSRQCEDPALRCDPTTYESQCNGDTLTACDQARGRVASVDCRETFDPVDGTTCGAPFTCTGRACDDVNVTCIASRAGARCDIAREVYCGPGLGCVVERDEDGAIFGTCRATTTCAGTGPAASCIADVLPVCLQGDGIIVQEAQGVDCASFGSRCAAAACVGGAGAVCQVLSRQDVLLRCEEGLACDDVDPEGFGTCGGTPDGPDAGIGPDASTPSPDGGLLDGSQRPPTTDGSGCSCVCSPNPPAPLAFSWGLLLVAYLLRRRSSKFRKLNCVHH